MADALLAAAAAVVVEVDAVLTAAAAAVAAVNIAVSSQTTQTKWVLSKKRRNVGMRAQLGCRQRRRFCSTQVTKHETAENKCGYLTACGV